MYGTRAPRTADWFRCFAPRPSASVRLVCFPHAGGAASAFRQWPSLLPEDVEVVAVQYPGRQDRYGEPCARSMAELVEGIVRNIEPLLDRPVAFFGHSMGATVAFETALRVQRLSPWTVTRLFASARKAPSAPPPVRWETFDDAEVLVYVQGLGGSGARSLLRDPELTELTLPVLRADFRLVAEYQHTGTAPLACPVTVLRGAAEERFTEADAREWGAHTIGGLDLEVLPGGHFYLEDVPEQVTALVAARLGLGAGPGLDASRNGEARHGR